MSDNSTQVPDFNKSTLKASAWVRNDCLCCCVQVSQHVWHIAEWHHNYIVPVSAETRGDQGTRVSITVSPAVQQLYDKFQTSDNKMWQQRSTISNNTHNSLNTSLYRVLNILKFLWKKLCLKTFRNIKLEMYVICYI